MYIYSGTAQISSCTFTNNQAPTNAGGAIYTAYGTTTISNTNFYGNYAADGGGMFYFFFFGIFFFLNPIFCASQNFAP